MPKAIKAIKAIKDTDDPDNNRKRINNTLAQRRSRQQRKLYVESLQQKIQLLEQSHKASDREVAVEKQLQNVQEQNKTMRKFLQTLHNAMSPSGRLHSILSETDDYSSGTISTLSAQRNDDSLLSFASFSSLRQYDTDINPKDNIILNALGDAWPTTPNWERTKIVEARMVSHLEIAKKALESGYSRSCPIFEFLRADLQNLLGQLRQFMQFVLLKLFVHVDMLCVEAWTYHCWHVFIMRADPSCKSRLPNFVAPTLLQQMIPHDGVLDYLPWPDIRDHLILHQDSIDTSTAMRILLLHCEFKPNNAVAETDVTSLFSDLGCYRLPSNILTDHLNITTSPLTTDGLVV